MKTSTTTTCGHCRADLADLDRCGYGGHDLNELFAENLSDADRFRCCDCLQELVGGAR